MYRKAPMPTINGLLREFDDPPFTERDFVRGQAALQQRFLLTYGIHDVGTINAAIHAGAISDGSALGDQWIALQQLRRYLKIDRPPRHG